MGFRRLPACCRVLHQPQCLPDQAFSSLVHVVPFSLSQNSSTPLSAPGLSALESRSHNRSRFPGELAVWAPSPPSPQQLQSTIRKRILISRMGRLILLCAGMTLPPHQLAFLLRGTAVISPVPFGCTTCCCWPLLRYRCHLPSHGHILPHGTSGAFSPATSAPLGSSFLVWSARDRKGESRCALHFSLGAGGGDCGENDDAEPTIACS